jgi:hypothetical protein
MLKSLLTFVLVAILALLLPSGAAGVPVRASRQSAPAATAQQKTPPAQSPTGPDMVMGDVAALGGACPTLSFTLGGTTVVTDASTTFRIACADIKVGAHIGAMGTRRPDGTLVATIVAAPSPSAQASQAGGASAPLIGTLAALGGACPVLSFTVDGTNVTTNASTEFRVACDAIKNGARIGVMGARQANGTVLARVVGIPPAGR